MTEPAILNSDLAFCEDEEKVLIEVTPTGGILSGTGIDGFYFDPKLAGVGTHIITYSNTDMNGLVETVSREVVVSEIPQPEILTEDLSFCEDEAPVLIEVTPVGGTLTGPGVSGRYFNPSLAGGGTHLIIYTISENGCDGTVSKEFIVNSVPSPDILNQDSIFCENKQAVLLEVFPEGGILFGEGVSGPYFDPQAAGVGTHVINYTVSKNGCERTVLKEFVVNAIPQPKFLNTDLTFCENGAQCLIEVSPSGGVLFGPGVSDLYFNPALAGIGTHTITYSITDESSCIGTVSTNIVVTENEEIDLGPDVVITLDDTLRLIPEIKECSLLWCDSTTNNKFTIIAKDLGVGIFKIWVEATSEGFCNSVDSMLLTIDSANAIIDEIDFLKAYIYPNPVTTGFYLALQENELIESICLYAQTGLILLNEKPSTFPYFNISHFAGGTYFLEVNSNKQNVIIQIVKL